jgi:cathepsin A (carboxypeptidase C)
MPVMPISSVSRRLLKQFALLTVIGNWLGNQAWTNALEWPGQKDFNKAEIKDLKIASDKSYGKVKSSGNFTFMQIYGAGHMVPMGKSIRLPFWHQKLSLTLDQPEASLDFLNNWLAGKWY